MHEGIILRPANPITESIAKISVDGNTIKASLPEFVDSFRLLMKGFGYGWIDRCWQRRIKPDFNGLVEDRLIELAYKILEANFIISFPLADLQEKIVAGDYLEEHTKWIYQANNEFTKYLGWFLIAWGRQENLYDQAKRIKGSRYSKPYVVAPPEQFEMVLDFAEQHDFRFSKKAQKVVDEAQESLRRAIRVELQPRSKKKIQPIDVKKGVADEFLDSD